jgi:hypothetical protein
LGGPPRRHDQAATNGKLVFLEDYNDTAAYLLALS